MTQERFLVRITVPPIVIGKGSESETIRNKALYNQIARLVYKHNGKIMDNSQPDQMTAMFAVNKKASAFWNKSRILLLQEA